MSETEQSTLEKKPITYDDLVRSFKIGFSRPLSAEEQKKAAQEFAHILFSDDDPIQDSNEGG